MSVRIKSGHGQGLAVCLVDDHGEGWPQRELHAPELERKQCVYCVDAGNEEKFAYAATN